MPRVYLSPSLQEYNLYVNGGTEEEITNLIADAMEPYLLASGIEFTRNRPEMSLGEAIAASNAGNYDLHFCHSFQCSTGKPGRKIARCRCVLFL